MTSEILLIEWANDHFYKVIEGTETHYIPSVTTRLGIIDKPNLARWRGDVGNREADLRMYDAANRGKRIHWAYATFLQGGAVIYDPWQAPIYSAEAIRDLQTKYGQVAILRTQEEMADLAKLKKQTDVLKPKVLGVELTVYDLEKRDAGTIDNILEINEGIYSVGGSKPIHLDSGVYVNDLKTGKYVDENVWLQLAAYGYMYELRGGRTIAGALVTHTGADTRGGISGLKTLVRDRVTLIKKDYQDYRHAAALWDRNNKDKEPKEFVFPSLITIDQRIGAPI